MLIFSFYVTRAFDWCIETYVLYKILCKTWQIYSHFMCQKKYTRELTKGSNHPIPPEKLPWTIAKGKATGKFGFIRFGCGFLHWLDFFSNYHLLTQEKKGLVEIGPENYIKVEQFFTLYSIEITCKKSRIFSPRANLVLPLTLPIQ